MTECAADALTVLLFGLAIPVGMALWALCDHLAARLSVRLSALWDKAGALVKPLPFFVVSGAVFALTIGLHNLNKNAVPCGPKSAAAPIVSIAAICPSR